MTNPSPGPSLVQARDSNTSSNSDASSLSHARSLIHRLAHKHAQSPRSLQHLHRHHSHSHSHRRRRLDDELASHTRQNKTPPPAHHVSPDAVKEADALLTRPVAQVQSLVEPADSSPLAPPSGPSKALYDIAPSKTVAIPAQPAHATLATSGLVRGASSRATSSYGLVVAAHSPKISPAYTNSSSSSSSSSALSSSPSNSWSAHTSTPSISNSSAYPTLDEVRNGTNTALAPTGDGIASLSNPASTANSTLSTANRNVVLSTPTSLSFTSSAIPTSSADSSAAVTANATSLLEQSITTSSSSSVPSLFSSSVSSASSFSSSSSSFSSSSFPSSITSTASTLDVTGSTELASSTAVYGLATGAAAESSPLTPTSTAESDSGPVRDLSPEQKRVIGSVVGSVAGAVFIIVLFMVLRYRKRKQDHSLLGGNQSTTTSRSGTGGDSGPVTERSGPSAVVATAFANLTGKKTPAAVPNDMPSAEGGFYRVSGKKLTPVLMTGGDGYSDPRASGASGHSDFFRGSQAFDPSTQGQLALGVPMRPVSGVPIMRSGPARIPVTENPFADPPSSPVIYDSPTRPPGSRGSRSKFLERL
ncbi:hypothetical protein CDD81_1371 [Ophiocordyceps australis]|uniref:Uncharacterized protein n=1 Tax=Ophiocordyceps australis TaxID=1399860 RepID=A0A2C5XZT8_9HYPO|nr:hypothetical protein CDD81_1371 [Ophiocordyceps australis]